MIADSNWSINEFIGLTGFCIFRRLGLIRRKSVAPASGNPGRSRFSKSLFSFHLETLNLECVLRTLWSFAEQVYDYLIVIDFESTCWKDGKHHRSPEISKFGLPVSEANAQ